MAQSDRQNGTKKKIVYSRDVRPILSNKCFKCHGPDESTREANLRLDTPDGPFLDLRGRRPFVRGDVESSEAWKRIQQTDDDQLMPPPKSGVKLNDQEKSIIRSWIEQGAIVDEHWSFKSVNRPQVPLTDDRWVQNGIDPFILDTLADSKLTPSTSASRNTLIRRVYLDLVGLPPSVSDVEEFLADGSDDAYSRMLDRVLSNPHYGERWGRHWLDQARYADTHGYTNDSERSMWPYRDWVIEAVNSDLPFDQFTIEQLAGDLLEKPTQAQLVATGFHRNTLINNEGGTSPEQFRVEAVVDRVNTTGAVWLGLTIGCAQCHSHKFDPITHKEYYQQFAFFNNSQDVNSVSPTLRLTTPEQQNELDEIDRKLADAKKAVAEYDRLKNESLPIDERSDGKLIEWNVVTVTPKSMTEGTSFEKLDDGSYVVGGVNGEFDTYDITFSSPKKRLTAIRLETLIHPALPMGGPGRADNGNFVLSEVELRSESEQAKWIHASADHSQKDYDISQAIDGKPETGWAIDVTTGKLNVNRTATFVLSPISLGTDAGSQVRLRLVFGNNPPRYNLGRFRISVTDAVHMKLSLPDEKRSPLVTHQTEIEQVRNKFVANIPETMVLAELPSPRETRVLIRGDFLRTGEPVIPATLPALSFEKENGSSEATRSRTRTDLARWLIDRKNPLTSRVAVNRVWARYFGLGFVETENDFGLQGTPPSHPELLDWIAVEFMERGWSLKRLHRLILESATFRQSSISRPDCESFDPRNRLLYRQNRLRVDAEIVRDTCLAVSGLFHEKIGGPSVYPPQPEGVYAFTQRQASWPTSKGPDRYRRGLYTFFMRSAPYPMLTTFDVPRFNTTCTMRVRSNTPLQSLTLANDESIIEFSRALGSRIVQISDDDRQRIDWAFKECLARNPDEYERSRLKEYVDRLRIDFETSLDDAVAVGGLSTKQVTQVLKSLNDFDIGSESGKSVAEKRVVEQAVWTSLARTLMNLDEFITRE